MINPLFNIVVIFCLFYHGSAQALSADSIATPLESFKEDSTFGTVSFRSITEGVKVFVDTIYIGTTPIENFIVTNGIHLVRYIHPDNMNWLYPAVVETVVINSREHIDKMVDFSHRCIVRSEPYGACVQYRDSILGTTPLILSVTSEIYLIKLSKRGFKDEITPLSISGGEISVKLEPVEGSEVSQTSFLATKKQLEFSSSAYIATGAAVLSGATAAYFKIRADRFYEDYRRTNSGTTLDKVRRLDTISGISLAATEISLFILSYYLLSQ